MHIKCSGRASEFCLTETVHKRRVSFLRPFPEKDSYHNLIQNNLKK
jgi:hypothetical protein